MRIENERLLPQHIRGRTQNGLIGILSFQNVHDGLAGTIDFNVENRGLPRTKFWRVIVGLRTLVKSSRKVKDK